MGEYKITEKMHIGGLSTYRESKNKGLSDGCDIMGKHLSGCRDFRVE